MRAIFFHHNINELRVTRFDCNADVSILGAANLFMFFFCRRGGLIDLFTLTLTEKIGFPTKLSYEKRVQS